MKHILTILVLIILSVPINAQLLSDFYDECIEPENGSLKASTTCNSEKGYYFPTKGTYRMLVIFVNIIYDVTPASNPNVVNNWGWNVKNQEGINQLPPTQYFNDVFDVNNTLPHQGSFTRYMSECSFDSLVILGDFTSVEIKQSRILATENNADYYRFMKSVINYINSNGGLQAMYGHNAIGDYDNATYNSTNNISRTSDNKLDYVSFLVLNPIEALVGQTLAKGGVTGSGNIANIKLSNGNEYPIQAWTAFNIGFRHLKHEAGVLNHEFAHGLLGPNAFHTSGGNHLASQEINTFLFIQKGYGLFNAENALRSCNAYERWRLGWRHPTNNSYKIAANGSNSDIISKFSGTQTYYLRDFVTYGDAIRIKLPYKDSESASNQYIWLENHQLGRNGKLDGLNFHFFPGVTCIPLGNPGIYSYIQVGKDVLEGSSIDVYPSNEKDNLRMINAEGNYNMRYLRQDLDCVGWANRNTFEYLSPNPISGGNDQTEAINTFNQNLQYFSDFLFVGNKLKNGTLYNQSPWMGDNFDGFESGRIMDISSNPTPINATTYYAKYYKDPITYKKIDDLRDTRRKYLTGLSIKMTKYNSILNSGDVFQVDIRWDDYDVKQDVNWAGDIVLKEKFNLLSNKTITLEQNFTPNQRDRDAISNFFAPPTKFTCESNSSIILAQSSKLIIKDNSSMIIENGAKCEVNSNAELVVKSGSNLTVKSGGILTLKDGALFTVELGATFTVETGGIIN